MSDESRAWMHLASCRGRDIRMSPQSNKIRRGRGAPNTYRPLTHSLDVTKEGLAMDATQTAKLWHPITEEWRPVLGWEGRYEVSNLGRVRSLDRYVTFAAGARRLYPGMVLRASLTKGYPHLMLKRPGYFKNVYVHTVVCEAFYGPRPAPNYDVRHLDGNPLNSTLGNLRWGTKTENSLDSVRHRTHKESRKTHCKNGHKFDVFSTNHLGRSRRGCSICRAAYMAEYKARPEYKARQSQSRKAAM